MALGRLFSWVCDPWGKTGSPTQKSPEPSLMLCPQHLEILNDVSTRGPHFHFAPGPANGVASAALGNESLFEVAVTVFHIPAMRLLTVPTSLAGIQVSCWPWQWPARKNRFLGPKPRRNVSPVQNYSPFYKAATWVLNGIQYLSWMYKNHSALKKIKFPYGSPLY